MQLADMHKDGQAHGYDLFIHFIEKWMKIFKKKITPKFYVYT